MKVLNFGSCNMDYVYNLSHFVMAGETIRSDNMTKCLGGKGFNQSIAIAKSGVKVYHAGHIGKDGQLIRETLEEHNVHTDFLQTVDTPTGHAIIQVNEHGENCIIIYSGANSCVTHAYVNYVLSHFDAGDILLLQNEINDIEYIVSCAYKKGMKIILNPSPLSDTLKRMDFNKLYSIVLNEVEGCALTGQSMPENILDCFHKNYDHLKVVLTLGAKGCAYFDCATLEECFCPAFCVDAKDTTAAGDTFMGYYIYGLIMGMRMEETLRLASAASALAVSQKGSSQSIPKISDVTEAVKTLKPYEL